MEEKSNKVYTWINPCEKKLPLTRMSFYFIFQRSKPTFEQDAEEEAVNEQRIAFEENMAKKESQMKELDRVSRSLSDELKALQSEVRVKRESEEQMKQVLKEYEKTISELIAEKEREKVTFEEDRLRLMAERDQSTDDLKVS